MTSKYRRFIPCVLSLSFVLSQTASEAVAQVSESLVFEIPADARAAALGGRILADLHPDLHSASNNVAL